MVEARTKKLSDGTAGGETLGGSPQMTGLQERPGSILLAKQHRWEGPHITPRLRAEEAASDLDPQSQWDSKLPKEERPRGQASWAAGPEWEMKGPAPRRSLGLIHETCLPQGRPLVLSLSTPDKSRTDTRRLRQPLPLKSKFSAWSVDLKGVMISSSHPHGWCSGLACSKHPRSPKHPRFLPGRRGTQRGW